MPTPSDLEVMIANNITLTAPAEPGLTWAAQVWMFENAFLVEHENPYQAVAMVVRELQENELYKAPGEAEDEIYATHLVVEEILEDERQEEEKAEAKREKEAQQKRQEELAEQAAFYADQFSPGEPGYCNPHKAQWDEVEDYPLQKLFCEEIPTEEEWVAWFKNEVAIFLEDGLDEIANMYQSMTHDTIDHPIIVLERNGKGYIWDGNHRVGASFSGNKKTIKAIVGTPTLFGID